MTLPAQYFRVGAGAVILNDAGLVFAFERRENPGAWQLPQGGLDHGEEPLQAIYRELFEETGIREKDLELIQPHPEPLAYELPAELRKPKTGRGQVQFWFLFRYKGDETSIDIKKDGEAASWQWMPFVDLKNIVTPFRRPLYERLFDRFQDHIPACGDLGSYGRHVFEKKRLPGTEPDAK